MSTTDYQSPTLLTLIYFYSWRRMRRASHEALTKMVVQRYHPIQTKEATILVSDLLANPENRVQHIQRTAASTIMSIVYDYPTLASGEDKTVQDIDRVIHFTARGGVRTSLVEFFPWMIHVPKRSILCPHFLNIVFKSKEPTGLQSGRGKPWSKLPYVPRCFYNC